jgi:cell fate (sporulation/competence/biofilm development) regulator YlbF (YheA/YmcA/DUF963 family)
MKKIKQLEDILRKLENYQNTNKLSQAELDASQTAKKELLNALRYAESKLR